MALTQDFTIYTLGSGLRTPGEAYVYHFFSPPRVNLASIDMRHSPCWVASNQTHLRVVVPHQKCPQLEFELRFRVPRIVAFWLRCAISFITHTATLSNIKRLIKLHGP